MSGVRISPRALKRGIVKDYSNIYIVAVVQDDSSWCLYATCANNQAQAVNDVAIVAKEYSSISIVEIPAYLAMPVKLNMITVKKSR